VATTATEEEKEMELGCGPSVHSGDENELRHSRLVVVFFFFFFFFFFPPVFSLSAREYLPGIINKKPR
jgi:hypothetical protein